MFDPLLLLVLALLAIACVRLWIKQQSLDQIIYEMDYYRVSALHTRVNKLQDELRRLKEA